MPTFYIETAARTDKVNGADLHIMDAMVEAQRIHGQVSWSKMTPLVVQGTVLASGDRVFVADLFENTAEQLNMLTAWVDAE